MLTWVVLDAVTPGFFYAAIALPIIVVAIIVGLVVFLIVRLVRRRSRDDIGGRRV